MRACPFCGFNEGWTRNSPWDLIEKDRKEEHFVVQCNVCGSLGPESKTREGAQRKWEGFLKGNDLRDQEGFKAALEEMDGAGTTPGMGNAQPASTAAMTGSQQASPDALGSGDKWDSSIGKPAVQEQSINPYDQIGTMMAKKMKVPMAFKKGKNQSTKHVEQIPADEISHKHKHKVSSYSDYANLVGKTKKKKEKKKT